MKKITPYILEILKKKNRFLILITLLVTFGFYANAQTTIGPFIFYSTNQGGTMLGLAKINGSMAVAGDIIAAFDPDGSCVGAGNLTINAGSAYINFIIYGDDGSGNGMAPGEDFTLQIYDASSQEIIEYETSLSGWINSNFAPMSGFNDPYVVYDFMSSVQAELPTVSTSNISGITQSSAQAGGNVTDDGGAEVTLRGVCWNISGSPTTNDNHTVDGTGTGTFNSSINGLSYNTNYSVRAYATNSVATAYGEEKEFTTLPNSGESYFETVWTTPFSPMNIYVTKATIDELNMVAGDEIGVFDVDPEDGNDICVGAGILVEELANGTYLTIIASMDDGIVSTNGFQSGNEMIFKLYSQSIGLVELVSTTFPYPGYDEVFIPLGTATVELVGVTVITQTLYFVEGWNLSSMRTLPEDMNMLSIVNPLIAAEELVKVINQDGGSVEHLPFPPTNGQWSNTIGDWVIEQGYYVNVNENTSLTITAPPVEIPLEIPLRAGWNMTGMPCEYPQSTEAILQPLINAGILVKAINDQGQAIEHLPFPPPAGQWVYGFEAFEPGEGYYIKANAISSLNFDCMSPYQSDAVTPKAQLQFFEPIYKNNPYMPMNAVLTGLDNLAMGDEIAIYDNGICVGAAVIDQFDFISIPVSMNDPLTEEIDGYTPGNTPSVSIWQNESNAIFEGNIHFISGIETFQPLETFVGELNVMLTEIGALISDNLLFEIAPNPFNASTWLCYTIPMNGDITIRIYNMAGQQELVLNNQQFYAGNGKISINGSSLIPGSYIMQINYSSQKGISIVNKKLFIK